jgi:hypothetical protein
MKIGIQILAYNCAETFEQLVLPWVKLKEKYDLKIWVGSGQFKIYHDMGCKNLNGPTIELLENLKEKGIIDYLFQPDPNNLLGDHTTRDKCIPWMRNNDIDLMVQVDADEFYTDEMAEGYLDWIMNNQDPDCYRSVLRGVVEEGVYEDWERFSAGWIKRHGGISHYYYDAHWSFAGEGNTQRLKGGEYGNIEYRWVPTVTVPKEISYPLHYTWNNDLSTTGPGHIKEKIEYQKRYYHNNECGYEWDEENNKVIKSKEWIG